MTNFLARLHLLYLVAKLKLHNVWIAVKARVAAKVKPIVAPELATLTAVTSKPWYQRALASITGWFASVHAHWSKVSIREKALIVWGMAALLLLALNANILERQAAVLARQKSAQPQQSIRLLHTSAVDAENKPYLVRVVELDEDGRTVLATTVSSDQIVEATSLGIIWHPIPSVTESWRGSYRLSK